MPRKMNKTKCKKLGGDNWNKEEPHFKGRFKPSETQDITYEIYMQDPLCVKMKNINTHEFWDMFIYVRLSIFKFPLF